MKSNSTHSTPGKLGSLSRRSGTITIVKCLLLLLLSLPVAAHACFSCSGNDCVIFCNSSTSSEVTIEPYLYGDPEMAVTDVLFGTFRNNNSLTRIVLPHTLVQLHDQVFASCTNLVGVYFEGNAPGVGADAFLGSTNATVYYLQGTTGWGATFAGRPTAVWQPRVRSEDGNFGVRTNQFGFNVFFSNRKRFVVEACTNLVNPVWLPLPTSNLRIENSIDFNVAHVFYFSDAQWTNFPNRIYRLSSQ